MSAGKIHSVNEMTDLILGWASRNFQFCNVYESLKEAAFKNMNEWNVDISETSNDADVQSFYYILNRVKRCRRLFDFLDLKLEVDIEISKRGE